MATLAQTVAALQRLESPLGLDDLLGALRELAPDQAALQAQARFDLRRYARNLLSQGPFYELLLLCWLPGQHTPVHDHCGSACGARVISGVATETRFTVDPQRGGHVGRSREWPAGSVIGTFDTEVHRMANTQPEGQPLLTLHLYSPPLRDMRTYASLETPD